MSGRHFQKGLLTHFRVCGALSKIDRSEVQIDSMEGYLTLWCRQPYPSQSLNPQKVEKFECQEVESGWIFQKVLG